MCMQFLGKLLTRVNWQGEDKEMERIETVSLGDKSQTEKAKQSSVS